MNDFEASDKVRELFGPLFYTATESSDGYPKKFEIRTQTNHPQHVDFPLPGFSNISWQEAISDAEYVIDEYDLEFERKGEKRNQNPELDLEFRSRIKAKVIDKWGQW